MKGLSIYHYCTLVILFVVFAVGWLGGQRAAIILVYGSVWALCTIGYDLFSGFSGRINLGYAMFPGVAGYASAALSAKFGVSPLLSFPIGVLSAVLLAACVGALTLRIKGIYFALSTAIVPLALFEVTRIVGRFFGGEEGIWGVPSFFQDPRYDLLAIGGILGVCITFALWYVGSKEGLILRAIRGGEVTAQALGVHTFGHLFVAFLLSAAIGGAAGAYLAHFQMLISPEVLHIITTLQVVTFTYVGGAGTIVGPVVASYLLVILNEALRAWVDLRLFAYFVGLVLILRFSPEGLLVPLGRSLGRLVISFRTASVRSK